MASQTVHENPDYLKTSKITPIDDQVSTLVGQMASDMEAISSQLHEKNYTAARAAYDKFSRDGGSLRDIICQFNVSGQDNAALGSDLDFMQADLNDLVEYADQYNRSLGLYNASLASGDSANASFYSSQLRASYMGLGMAYNKLYTNATSAGDLLSDMGVDTGQYASAIDDLNSEINRLVGTYDEAVPGERASSLWLSANTDEAKDSIHFQALLSDGNRSPIPDAQLAVYINGSPVGTIITGPNGNASLDYKKPAGMAGEPAAHAVYVPAGPKDQTTYSNDVRLTFGPAPTMDTDSDNAAFGDVVRVFGDLTGADGAPVGGRSIDILVNGDLAGRVITLNNGSYSYALGITPDFPAGTCMVNAVYQTGSGRLVSPGKPLNISPMGAVLTADVPTVMARANAIDVNGSLMASNGVPVSGAKILIYFDGALAGTAVTNDSGFYNQSIGIPEDTSSGSHFILTSFNTSAGRALQNASSGAHSITMPDVTRGKAGGEAFNYVALIATGLAILIVLILVTWRLLRRKSIARPQILDAVPVQEPIPSAPIGPEKPDLEKEMAPIMADLGSKNMKKAQRGIYFLTIKATMFWGMAIKDSMTPREVQKAASSILPAIFVPLSMIVSTYEKAAFGPGDLEPAEVLRSIDCMNEIFTTLNIGGSEVR